MQSTQLADGHDHRRAVLAGAAARPERERPRRVGAHRGRRHRDHQYYDQTIPREQFEREVSAVTGGRHTFDAEPVLFRLAVEALRTHLAHAFDPQFAVSVSQVDPLPHQLDAVYKHMLPLSRIRFLLADDPGAGKTIMAGLLLRELMQRGDVSRVLVLCPKALTDQWRREMWERFRERFTLVTGESVSSGFGQNVWVENDRVVASVDLAIQDHILPGLEQATWDIVIFDEAHKLSAYRYGAAGKIDKTKRYRLAEELAERTKHLLLMTATPHKGDPENFRLLLSLLDDKAFASQAGVESALKQDRSPYFLRRTKEGMKHFDGRPLFLPRHVHTAPYAARGPRAPAVRRCHRLRRDGLGGGRAGGTDAEAERDPGPHRAAASARILPLRDDTQPGTTARPADRRA